MPVHLKGKITVLCYDNSVSDVIDISSKVKQPFPSLDLANSRRIQTIIHSHTVVSIIFDGIGKVVGQSVLDV